MYLCFHKLRQKSRELFFLTSLNSLDYLLLYQTSLAVVMMEKVQKKPSSAALPERNMLVPIKPDVAGLELWRAGALFTLSLQDHRMVEGGRDFVQSPLSRKASPPSLLKAGSAQAGCWKLCPAGFCIPPLVETPLHRMSPWALSASHQISWTCVGPICLMHPNLIIYKSSSPCTCPLVSGTWDFWNLRQKRHIVTVFFAIKSLLHVVTGPHFIKDVLYSWWPYRNLHILC